MALFIEIACKVVGGLGIFLLGMKYMSDGLQTIAGNRLRTLISAVTNNRFMAVTIGLLVTCVVQSSSITTVMAVGFVNSGFMTLAQSMGVVMGANIGTTITGWILVLKIGKAGLPILGIAALVFRFSKRDGLRFIAMVFMGLGMIFFGLELMKNGFQPLREAPDFEKWFHAFNADTYIGVLKCAAIGCMLTLIVQSSSATLGITIGLAVTGIVTFRSAAALILGENIGTTITAYLASLGATTNAKRAAYWHVIFNVIGVLWITAIFPWYIEIIERFLNMDPTTAVVKDGIPIYPYVTIAIAIVHTVFNITNTLLFLPFVNFFKDFLIRVVPDTPYKEPPHLTHLDVRVVESPAIGVEQSRAEILRMCETTRKMMTQLEEIINNGEPDDRNVKKLFNREEILDTLQKEIVVFLTTILSGSTTLEVADEGRRQLRMADEMETISDYLANILKYRLRLNKSNLEYTQAEQEDLIDLHKAVTAYFDFATTSFENRNQDVLRKAHAEGGTIQSKFKDLRHKHLTAVSEVQTDPLVNVLLIDTLTAYRRISGHIYNFLEALAGEK